MSKAEKKAGRPKREKISQVRRDLRHYEHESYLSPNRYTSAVLKNVGIAVLFFGSIYATAIYLGQPATTETSMDEKSRGSRTSGKKIAHASPFEEQQKKTSIHANPTLVAGITAFVSGNNVLIRENPKLNSRVLGKAIFGTSVDVTASDGKWIQIKSPAQNLSGWTERASLNF